MTEIAHKPELIVIAGPNIELMFDAIPQIAEDRIRRSVGRICRDIALRCKL